MPHQNGHSGNSESLYRLWWACHSNLQTKIHHSKRLQLERSCFLKANRGVGNNGVVMAKNNTKCWCKCFGKYSPQELKAIYLSKHEPSTSSGWLYTCTYLYHIRMDTPEPQKQFGLRWACHSISRLKSLIQRDSNSKCRNNILVLRTTPNIGANVLANFPINCENNIHQKIWTINIFISRSLHNGIPSLKRFFLPKSSSEATAVYVLCIHGGLGLQEPLRHGVVAFVGCVVQRCHASGAADPRRKPQGRKQTERRGEKLPIKKLGTSKVEVLENCGHSRFLPELKLTLWFWDVLRTSSWLKRPCEPGWQWNYNMFHL